MHKDATQPSEAPHAAGHHGVGHLVSPKVLIATAMALLMFTAMTVWAAQIDFAAIDLKELNILVALTIAVIKGSLVCLYFMHLRWDRPFNAFVLVASLSLLALFIGFAMTDKTEYEHEIIPGESQVIQTELTKLSQPAQTETQ